MILYGVTDSSDTTEDYTLEMKVEEALKGGATFIQLREKNMDTLKLAELGKRIKKICDKYNAPMVIDDNVEAARLCGADGVHVGQNDLSPDKVREILGNNAIVGVTAKTPKQAVEAELKGASYIGTGAAFPTDTKKDTYVISHDAIRAICESTKIPVVAIGGITYDNVDKLKGTGIDGVAVVSAIFNKKDIEHETQKLKKKVINILEEKMKKVLTIAGSDCSGGAGIQADLKTMTAHKVYGMSVITALTAQNTTGVYGIMEAEPEFVAKQIDCVFTDIEPDAVKIGMVSNKDIIKAIASKLREYKAKNIVADPVMISTSGKSLINSDARDTLINVLLPIAAVITPNIPEAEALSGISITDDKLMEKAAKIIGEKTGTAVLIKGGHSVNDANDLLYSEGKLTWFYGKKIENNNTHGTGCTLSSAIASNLALGYTMEDSIRNAKDYITSAIGAGLNLGAGSGPLNHMSCITSRFGER